MLKIRIIPTLLVKTTGLFKGKNFLSDRYVGALMPSIKTYNMRDVDEIAIFDKEGEFVDLKGITNKDDTVQGWLRENEVVLIIEKMCEITQMDMRLVLLRSAFREERDGRHY